MVGENATLFSKNVHYLFLFDGIIFLIFSGGVTVAQRFLVPLVEVRIFTGEFCLISSEVERRFCKPYVAGSIPALGLKLYLLAQ